MGSSRDGSMAEEKRDQDGAGRTRQSTMEEGYTRGIACHLLHRTLVSLSPGHDHCGQSCILIKCCCWQSSECVHLFRDYLCELLVKFKLGYGASRTRAWTAISWRYWDQENWIHLLLTPHSHIPSKLLGFYYYFIFTYFVYLSSILEIPSLFLLSSTLKFYSIHGHNVEDFDVFCLVLFFLIPSFYSQ